MLLPFNKYYYFYLLPDSKPVICPLYHHRCRLLLRLLFSEIDNSGKEEAEKCRSSSATCFNTCVIIPKNIHTASTLMHIASIDI